ncbi:MULTISPECIES: hypothetical protein [unclassified Microcoleus]|uniref:hypothetical protein n=1 Tax=unclassified Microcoleus TaxID=2642155 RepID=UPI002FD411E7
MTARAVIDIMIARAKITVKVARAIIEEIFNMAGSYGKSGQKENQRHSSPRRGGLGGAGRQSESDGNEITNRSSEGDCTGIYRDSKGSVNRGEASFGKILSQVRELQHSHLAYVEAHEERLQARLKAAKEHHDQVLDQMKLLEQEILFLLGEAV